MKIIGTFILSLLAVAAIGQPAKPATSRPMLASLTSRASAATRFATNELVARGLELQQTGQAQTALQYYRQAMLGGDSEGAYLTGRLTWDEAEKAQGRSRLQKQRAALESYLHAATNLHARACLKLAEAFQAGSEVPQDRTRAYTWLKIARDIDPATPIDLLDQAAVKLTPPELDQAQATARQYLAGGWPESVTAPLLEGDSRLKVTGVTTGLRTTVMINHVTLQTGDSTVVPIAAPKAPAAKNAPQSLGIRCLAVGLDYILLEIDGEREQRLLRLDGL